MPVDEIDDAALERKYPPDLLVKNKYFFHYVDDGFFGWYFDSKLCRIKFLSDYQRIVIFNDGGHEYTSWSRYREFYNTPEADRDYLRYWETIVKELKWLEQYLLTNESSIELSFRDALEKVYALNVYSAHDRSMKYELKYGNSNMELAFAECTKGITDSVPEYKARELIAQEIRWTYARKKLKIAELIGLIPKDNIVAA
ncbi:hypothetical protein D1007_22328 [Hordeum vulgare]|nr:hypothetical protein D1007_22328 [Hordeum vulgare]